MFTKGTPYFLENKITKIYALSSCILLAVTKIMTVMTLMIVIMGHISILTQIPGSLNTAHKSHVCITSCTMSREAPFADNTDTAWRTKEGRMILELQINIFGGW